jgi:type I restriction enzyme M protein
MADKLTSATIVDHLWSAANVLRGCLASDETMLGVLLVLLLLKREADSGHNEDVAPLKRLWMDAETKGARDVDARLIDALRAIGHKRPVLAEVPDRLGWSDQIPALRSTRELGVVVDRLRDLDLRDANVDDPRACGDAAGLLIEKFERASKHGGHSTPGDVVDLMTTLVAPVRGMRIADPFCGHGRYLAACARRLGPANAVLLGQDIDRQIAAIAAMNLALRDCWSARVEAGDTLTEPRFVEHGVLEQADVVMSTPPFGGTWNAEEAIHDRFGRFHRGVPPRNRRDFAVILHMLSMVAPQGRLAVVVLGGALFRAGAEAEIRNSLIRDDLVEAIIGLPPSTLYATAAAPFILLLNRAKPAQRRGRILFVQSERTEDSKQRKLPRDVSKKVAEAYAQWVETPGFSRIIPNHEITEANLSPGRYVARAQQKGHGSLDDLASKARLHEAERDEATAEMDRLLKTLADPTPARGAR